MKQSQSHEPFFPGRPGAICRRDFLISGVKASLCFIACDALGVRASAADQPGLPPSLADSLHIIREYLPIYSPPAADFPASGSWKATYDILQRAPRKKSVCAHLTVTRRPVPGGVTYDTVFTNKLFDFVSSMKSSMSCSADRLPRLVEWTTDFETHIEPDPAITWVGEFNGPIPDPAAVPPMSLREHGRHAGDLLEVSTSLNTRKLKTGRPVVPQWAILDALRNAKADPADPMAGLQFDLLHNLTSYRPNQLLKPSGILDITMAGGKSQTFHGFYQVGSGVEPTHYWIDSRGRPLFMTEGLISAALTAIDPA